jgi:hypothetical protein
MMLYMEWTGTKAGSSRYCGIWALSSATNGALSLHIHAVERASG